MEDDRRLLLKAFLYHTGLGYDIGHEIGAAMHTGSMKGVSSRMPSLRTARTGLACVALSSSSSSSSSSSPSSKSSHSTSLIAFGGHNRETGRLNCTEILHHNETSWVSGPSLVAPRFLFGAGSIQGGVLAAGGDDGGSYLTSVEYLPSTESNWTHCMDLPAPRRGCGSAGINGGLFLVGGHDGVSDVATTETIRLEEGGRVESGPTLPGALFLPGVCEEGGRVYCCGGFGEEVGERKVYALDLREGVWQKSPPLREARGGAACCSSKGRVRVYGGMRGDAEGTLLSSSESFCPIAGRWTTLTPLSTALSGAGCAEYREGVAIVGGSRQAAPGESENMVNHCVQII